MFLIIIIYIAEIANKESSRSSNTLSAETETSRTATPGLLESLPQVVETDAAEDITHESANLSSSSQMQVTTDIVSNT